MISCVSGGQQPAARACGIVHTCLPRYITTCWNDPPTRMIHNRAACLAVTRATLARVCVPARPHRLSSSSQAIAERGLQRTDDYDESPSHLRYCLLYARLRMQPCAVAFLVHTTGESSLDSTVKPSAVAPPRLWCGAATTVQRREMPIQSSSACSAATSFNWSVVKRGVGQRGHRA